MKRQKRGFKAIKGYKIVFGEEYLEMSEVTGSLDSSV